MNLLLEKESLVFIEEYLGTIHVIMMLSVKEYILSIVRRMSRDILVDRRLD